MADGYESVVLMQSITIANQSKTISKYENTIQEQKQAIENAEKEYFTQSCEVAKMNTELYELKAKDLKNQKLLEELNALKSTFLDEMGPNLSAIRNMVTKIWDEQHGS